MNESYRVLPGGLMRCCLATLHEAMEAAEEPPKEGDKLQCKYHDGEGMIFCAGFWQWNHPPLVVTVESNK